jgi:hypothetical protein
MKAYHLGSCPTDLLIIEEYWIKKKIKGQEQGKKLRFLEFQTGIVLGFLLG